jgi:RimJ/RimL family protein N-acetyltransferase
MGRNQIEMNSQQTRSFLLITPRLIIRPFQDSDLGPFVAYRDDPKVALYQGWNVPYTIDQGREFIERLKTAVPGTVGEWYQAAVEIKSTYEMIGDVAFHVMKSDSRQAYIGYSFSRSFWGQGYATEAVKALLDYLFLDMNLHRVVAECDVENISSIRLLERLRFRREAHFIENVWFKGAYGSEFYYAMLKREWEQK